MMATHVRVIGEALGLITGWLNRGWLGRDVGLLDCALDPALTRLTLGSYIAAAVSPR